MKYGFDWQDGFGNNDLRHSISPEHVYTFSSPCDLICIYDQTKVKLLLSECVVFVNQYYVLLLRALEIFRVVADGLSVHETVTQAIISVWPTLRALREWNLKIDIHVHMSTSDNRRMYLSSDVLDKL